MKLTEQEYSKLINDVKEILSEIIDFECKVERIIKTNNFELKPSVLVTMPHKNTFDSRWIMQSFNTPIYRARRRRDLRLIEITYRKD